MKNRITTLLLATLVVFALTLTSMASVDPFSDVPADHWAYDAISTLANAGLIEGYPDGTFGGSQSFTRYEMAEVFARMFVAFENQISDRIDSQSVHMLARSDQLAEQLQATKDAIATIIENDESLAERITTLENQANPSSTSGGRTPGGDVTNSLTQEAFDTLADQIVGDVIDRLVALENDQDAIVDSLGRLEQSKLDTNDAKEIAEAVVADVLGDITDDRDLARRVAALEQGAPAHWIQEQVSGLDQAMRALAGEYETELHTLGVKVDDVEKRLTGVEARLDIQSSRIDLHEGRLDTHGSQLGSIWDRLPSFNLTAKNSTVFHRTKVVGNKNWEDPRDEDSSKRFVDKADEMSNVLTLGMSSAPADGVDIDASFDIHTKLFREGDDSPLETKLANFDFLLTAPGTLRHIHAGKLDRDYIAGSFNKYMVDAKKFDDEDTDSDDKTGIDFSLVTNPAKVDGFLTRIGTNQYVYGGAAHLDLGRLPDLTFSGVRHTYYTGGVDRDTVISVETGGELGPVELAGFLAHNYKSEQFVGEAYELRGSLPVGPFLIGANAGGVAQAYRPLFAKDLESYDPDIGPDWYNKLSNGDEDEFDWNEQGDYEYFAWMSVPLLGSESKLAVGQRDDAAGINDYTQAQIGIGLFSGVDTTVLFDRRTNEIDQVDNSVLVNLGVELLGIDVDTKIIHRTNDQSWTHAEAEQLHTYVTATKDVDFFLPLQLEGRFGTSRSAPSSHDPHSYLGVSTEQYMLGDIALRGGYSVSGNYVDPKYWWINDQWTGQSRNELVFGADYTFNRLFGFLIDAGYEYKTIWIDDQVDGDPQHTFRSAFERNILEATLDGEIKYVIGGVTDHKGNDRDLTTKVNVTYPIFDGGKLSLGGVYVSSQGNKSGAESYEVYDIKAGLEVAF